MARVLPSNRQSEGKEKSLFSFFFLVYSTATTTTAPSSSAAAENRAHFSVLSLSSSLSHSHRITPVKPAREIMFATTRRHIEASHTRKRRFLSEDVVSRAFGALPHPKKQNFCHPLLLLISIRAIHSISHLYLLPLISAHRCRVYVMYTSTSLYETCVYALEIFVFI